MNKSVLVLLIFVLFFRIGGAHAQDTYERYDQDCMPLRIQGKHGPFDYNRATQGERTLVETPHFTEHYQAYRLGKNRFQKKHDGIIETPAAGFSYTLWAFPNHPFALAAMEDISVKSKSDKPQGAQLRVHCYFQRAVKFSPEDPVVRALYGYYFARRDMDADAAVQLELAESTGEGRVNVAVYASFAYYEMGDLDKSLAAAKRAYQLGYNLPGLRNRLERIGKWKD